jgi:hypothetical protein
MDVARARHSHMRRGGTIAPRIRDVVRGCIASLDGWLTDALLAVVDAIRFMHGARFQHMLVTGHAVVTKYRRLMRRKRGA